ncbi:2OG-Fe(II) oxygenase [Phenylobacterium sp.]|uniref:2OG-Fe(II) oxygenase family protein n=1 Tax=Phenylobacterium sp. TaxID=1871053 RepID=UPI0035B36D8D
MSAVRTPGDPAPWFDLPTHGNPNYHFASLGGRWILLAFLPPEGPERTAMLDGVAARRDQFDVDRLIGFFVERDRRVWSAQAEARGLRWFLDEAGRVAAGYGAQGEDGRAAGLWVLVDPSLRIWATAPGMDGRVLDALRSLPAPADHAGASLNAPVLIVPRVFEPEICRELIGVYERHGGAPSGVMREREGRTVPVLDDFKKRRDALIGDATLCAGLTDRISRRLVPEIRKAFQFAATRIERHIVACYDAADGGYFRPHRDNTTKGTAHRRFAVSINLDAEAHEGGDLRFPEFGPRTYRPPTGGAVVFSCSLLHEATPVTRGRRYAYLPFLYDEAAAQVRQENLKFLGDPQGSAAA